ncbi:MAG: hypothetical protein LQ346_004574 [Caloplaca aetnensis]|nr:MAG: hypothetical protein LQ346_004574 [Caloplaca aetnensis]
MDTKKPPNQVAPNPETSREAQWYSPNLESLSPQSRELFEQYSHIPPDKLLTHIHAIREKAWEIFPYPCIGQWRFLDLSISQHPAYPRILSRLKQPPSPEQPPTTLLDLGCCFAQDIRKLIHDGAPGHNLYGCDLNPEFLDLGYDLFLDCATCPAHFFAADIFAPNDEMRPLEGKIDIIHAASFLHIFGWEDQVSICRQMIRLLRPQKGSLVIGRQVGNLAAGEMGENAANKFLDKGHVWRHNDGSFRRMWAEVGEVTGTRWDVRVDSLVMEDEWRKEWRQEGVRRLVFEVERME